MALAKLGFKGTGGRAARSLDGMIELGMSTIARKLGRDSRSPLFFGSPLLPGVYQGMTCGRGFADIRGTSTSRVTASFILHFAL